MLFQVQDHSDDLGTSKLRGTCFGVLQQIQKDRAAFLRGCAGRPHLADLSTREQEGLFTNILLAALHLGRSGKVPGPDAGAFLKSLADPEDGLGVAGSLALRMTSQRPDPRAADLRDLVAVSLALWPGFDDAAFRAGSEQNQAFMDAFAEDFPVLRQRVFDFRKIQLVMRDLGEAGDEAQAALSEIHLQFMRSSFGAALFPQVRDMVGAVERRAQQHVDTRRDHIPDPEPA